jgi:hypothetical protein
MALGAQHIEVESWIPTRVKWSAIFAGWAVGLAVQMTLTLLGLAIGAWAIDVNDAEPTRGIPIGSAVWTGVSLLAAAFAGGYLTARLSGATRQSDGMYQGAVVWAVNWLVFAWLTTTALSFIIGGVFNAVGSSIKTLAQGAGQAVSAAANRADTASGAVDTKAMRTQIEDLLASTGKPELQPGTVRNDVSRVTDEARGGKPSGQISEQAWTELQQKLSALDRDAAVNVMVNKFGVSETRAREITDQVGSGANQAAGKVQEAGAAAKEKAKSATNAALSTLAAAAWWLFIGAFLTLGVSAVAGRLGVVPAIPAETAFAMSEAAARRAG